ncbi:MAG: Coenzyme F420 hydrogenase/dehydrogenase, beta subunit C-terminal domain [Rhodobacteraceae bacterium]|nr:Coenzyme F420 hydrogenase/dehydrogenase, beta subunit C-terminal domain [Paracoccaceae bacterium]
MQNNIRSESARSLARVERGNLCSGCGACALIAPDKIKMEIQPPGYLRPCQTGGVTEEQDQMIAQVCPGLGQTVIAGDRPDDPLWGPYLEMHVGYATDPALRHTASSGGALSAVLVHLLKTGQVDAVVQTGAAADVPNANAAVLSRDERAVFDAAGSRYAPSAPLAALAPLLNGEGRFAFVGKPCDVAALRALAARDPRIDDRIPVMLSFFCAGVPSLTGSAAVIEALGTTLADTRAFRYRGNGWPGRATATLNNGSTLSMSYHDSWGMILSRHVQHRCKICADGTGTAADIVCADAWVSDAAGYPLFEERDGISLIVSRTEKGAAMLAAAAQAGEIQLEKFDTSNLASIQPGQTVRRRALLARLLALRCLGRATPRYRGLHLVAAARQNSPARNMRNFWGMVRRSLTR